jgi:ligand-binding sensor domain-containing protein
MKKLITLLLCLVVLSSCEKSDEPGKNINMNFKHLTYAGESVSSIAFDNLGNAWFCTFNAFWPGDVNKPELIKFNLESNSSVVYDASNSPLKDSIIIWDIAVDSKNNVWIGCDGLIKFDGLDFTKFTSKNTIIPEDFINSIVIDSKDNIWFSSSRVSDGGLVMYDGTDWNVFTPDNSPLPMNGVGSVAIDHNDNVWLALYANVGKASLVKITGDTWTAYTNEELGFAQAQLNNIVVNSKNHVLGALDNLACYHEDGASDPQIIIFDGTASKYLRNDSLWTIEFITVDNMDNIWCVVPDPSEDPVDPPGSTLAVYDGRNWLIDSLTFKDTRISTIVQSKDSKIWLGTENGIYIND